MKTMSQLVGPGQSEGIGSVPSKLLGTILQRGKIQDKVGTGKGKGLRAMGEVHYGPW